LVAGANGKTELFGISAVSILYFTLHFLVIDWRQYRYDGDLILWCDWLAVLQSDVCGCCTTIETTVSHMACHPAGWRWLSRPISQTSDIATIPPTLSAEVWNPR